MRPPRVRWGRRLRFATIPLALAMLAGLLIAGPAEAVETQAVLTATGPAFNDGNWGWFKLVVEKDTGNNQIRIKNTMWCEPDNVLGGTKVACDAILMGSAGGGGGSLQAQYYDNGLLRWQGASSLTTVPLDADTSPGPFTGDYSPPSAGYSVTSAWSCSDGGFDDYRGFIDSMAWASSNQWSSWYLRVTPTDHDLNVEHC